MFLNTVVHHKTLMEHVMKISKYTIYWTERCLFHLRAVLCFERMHEFDLANGLQVLCLFWGTRRKHAPVSMTFGKYVQMANAGARGFFLASIYYKQLCITISNYAPLFINWRKSCSFIYESVYTSKNWFARSSYKYSMVLFILLWAAAFLSFSGISFFFLVEVVIKSWFP